MNALECVVEFVRDSIVQPNVGNKWVNTWTPLLLTLVPVHPRREPDRPDSDLRRARRCSITRCCTCREDSFLAQVTARRRHRDRQLQRHRGAGDDHLLRDHRRRRRARTASSSTGRTWCRTALPLADLRPADPDRDHGHVRPAVRADDATCGQHDRRPHRDSGDPVVRVHLRGACSAARSPASASASCSRCRWRSAISVLEIIVVLVQAYVFTLLDGRVHRHGHSRSSLSDFRRSRRTAYARRRRHGRFALAYMGAGDRSRPGRDRRRARHRQARRRRRRSALAVSRAPRRRSPAR